MPDAKWAMVAKGCVWGGWGVTTYIAQKIAMTTRFFRAFLVAIAQLN